MAAVKMVSLMVVIMVIGGAISAEAITCGQVTGGLAPCINYLKSGGAPPPACCNGVRSINNQAKTTPDRQTACNCIKSAAKSIAGLNQANAAALPGKCGVNIPYKISFNTDCTRVK